MNIGMIVILFIIQVIVIVVVGKLVNLNLLLATSPCTMRKKCESIDLYHYNHN